MWSYIKKIFTFVTLAIALIWVSIFISFIPKIRTVIGETDEPLKCTLAESGRAPYHVFIELDGYFHCSGTLIHKQYVLTLARCVFNPKKKEVHDKAGMKIFVGTRTIPGGTPYDVEKITCHPSFHYETFKDDIAVVQLKKEVSPAHLAYPITLPNNGITPYKGLKLGATGYKRVEMEVGLGLLWDQHISSMQVISSETCQKLLKQISWNLSGKFCAVADPGYSSCLIGDDRGSPVITDDEHVFIGIAIECARSLEPTSKTFAKKLPQLFIDVSSYITFIKSAIA